MSENYSKLNFRPEKHQIFVQKSDFSNVWSQLQQKNLRSELSTVSGQSIQTISIGKVLPGRQRQDLLQIALLIFFQSPVARRVAPSVFFHCLYMYQKKCTIFFWMYFCLLYTSLNLKRPKICNGTSGRPTPLIIPITDCLDTMSWLT